MNVAQELYDNETCLDLIEPDGGNSEVDGDEPEAWMETIWELEEDYL